MTAATTRRLRALVAILAGSLLLSGCSFDVYSLPLPGGAEVGDDPIEVTMEFRDVLDLVPESAVKINEITVGKVTSIEADSDSYTALVTVQLREDLELPDNISATIRQTSLLGEKFVSIDVPPEGERSGSLKSGDGIGLAQTGRNPEVEEVLGALSLILNGGGIAQVRSITTEVNEALGGREESTRSALSQLDDLMGQLDDHKTDIVNAIESLNNLSVGAREQMDSIDAALEDMPSAVDSLATQRHDLVRMLNGLNRLGRVGVRVIDSTRQAALSSLQMLEPVLIDVNAASDDFVNALSTFLTFPFIDETVGRDPQVARNLHMGDYVNLSIDLDLDLADMGLPDLCLPEVDALPCDALLSNLQRCIVERDADACDVVRTVDQVVDEVCTDLNLDLLCGALGPNRQPATPEETAALLHDQGVDEAVGLGRVPLGVEQYGGLADLSGHYDPALVALLGGPMVVNAP